MRHIHNLYIEGYRGIKNLKLDDLGQFNLLVGRNNVGKTSVLECIELITRPGDIGQFIMTSRGRDRRFAPMPLGISLLDSILWSFPIQHFGTDNISRDQIKTTANVSKGHLEYKIECSETSVIELQKNKKNQTIDELDETRALEISLEAKVIDEKMKETHVVTENTRSLQKYAKAKFIDARMITPVDHRVIPVSSRSISNSIMRGDKHNLIHLLQDFDENIEGIEILSPGGVRSAPYFKHRLMGYVPVSVYGDGVRRILTIASGILQSKNGLLLIDEIETAIHAKLLQKFFDWLVKTCKMYNVQLIATTHSLEAVDSILLAEKESLNELTTYRLDKDPNDGATIEKRFIGENLYDLRYELGQDVRG